MVLLTTILSLAALPPLPPQDEPASLVRWYDVRSLVMEGPQRDAHGVDFRHLGGSSALHNLEPNLYDLPHHAEPFSLADEGIDGILDDLLSEHEGIEIAFVDQRQGFIRLEGSPAAHDEAQRILNDLRAFVDDSVEVEVVRLPRGTWHESGRALLDRAEAEALLAKAGALPRMRTTATIGKRTHLGVSAVVGSLIDYDVEVAQGSLATDPQVSILQPGLHLGLVVRRAVDGGLLLEVWGRDGALDGPLVETKLGAYGDAMLETGRLRTALWTTSATLESGGAVLFGASARNAESPSDGLPGGTENGPLLVRLTEAHPADPSVFLSLGQLVSRPMFVRPIDLKLASPSGGWSFRDLDMDALGALLDVSDVVDVLEDIRSDEELSGRMLALGDRIYLPDDGSLRERAHATVRDLSRAMSSGSFEVDLRWDLVPRDEVAGRADASASDWAEQLRSRSAGVVRSGDTFLMSSGAETRYLADYDVEIAQASTIGDPIQSIAFEGSSLWCQPASAGEGRVAAWVELDVHAPLELRTAAIAHWQSQRPASLDDKPVLHGEFKTDAEIQIATTRRARAHTRFSAGDGEWGMLAMTPVAESDRYLVAVLKVTSR